MCRKHTYLSSSSSYSSSPSSPSQSWWWPVPFRPCHHLRAWAAKKEELPSAPRACVTLNLYLGGGSVCSIRAIRRAAFVSVCYTRSVSHNKRDRQKFKSIVSVGFTHQKKRKENSYERDKAIHMREDMATFISMLFIWRRHMRQAIARHYAAFVRPHASSWREQGNTWHE